MFDTRETIVVMYFVGCSLGFEVVAHRSAGAVCSIVQIGEKVAGRRWSQEQRSWAAEQAGTLQ